MNRSERTRLNNLEKSKKAVVEVEPVKKAVKKKSAKKK